MRQEREVADDFKEAEEASVSDLALLHRWPDAAARSTIVAVAMILAWLTWAHWGDIQVDCGRELYVPAEILRGKLLYRDLWYPYGPLEPYLAAALLWVFGQHLNVFYLFGLTLAAACALISFDIGKMLAGRAVGLTVAFALLLQGFQGSIFNYIFPYSYAATLGLLLALLCALFALRHVLGRAGHNLVLAGLGAGLALLCKQESGVSCYVMLVFVLVAEAALHRPVRALVSDSAACVPGFLLSVAIYGWFSWRLGLSVMVYNWIGPDRYFTQTYAYHLYYGSGFRLIPLELSLLVLDATLAMLLWFWSAKIGATRVGRSWWYSVAIALFVAGGAAARQFAPLATALALALLVYPRGMFFIGSGFLIRAVYALRNKRRDRLLLAKATLGVFALVLAIRVMAQAVPSGYSIFYGVPLLLVFIIAVKERVEAALPIEQRHRVTNLLLAAEVLMLAIILVPAKSERTAKLDTGWGDIYLEPKEATVARQILVFVSEQKQLGRRVVLLPELPMIYALTGTEAPNRLYTLQPGFLPPSHETDYITDLKLADPSFILVTSRNTSEYGVPYFGIDYDREVYRWIQTNYRLTGQFGSFRRDGGKLLTALLYRRNEPSRRASTTFPISSGNERMGTAESRAPELAGLANVPETKPHRLGAP